VATVWLKLPSDSTIRTRRLSDGRTTLTVPAGTVADRVESIGGRVVDVRGTRFEPGGRELFHVFRPDQSGRLYGYEWERGNAEAARTVAGLFDRRLRKIEGDRSARRFAGLLDCAGCHIADKLPNRRPFEGGLPNRATDASGLYQILAVLFDESPLEQYRPREMNIDDPLVQMHCRRADPPRITRGRDGSRGVDCADGSVPVGRFDLPAALRAGDTRAAEICIARRMLFRHLDSEGRRAFAQAFTACDPSAQKSP
jgi:hypothetical protein